jgi:glycosyltransferase involved in cell wall biosynthesis/radical SAM superfamily enzyme YgiQ (UPF0313 family)
LLTTSAAPTQSPFSTSEKRPPLGIGFLISVLRDAGHEVFFIDNYLKPSDFLDAGYLQEHSIDVAGVYANTICFRDTLRMLYAMESLRRTRQWQGKIVVGGPHTTVAPETIPDFVDHIVQGEGEQAICDIVEGRVSERVVRYPRLTELDRLPRPAWDCFVDKPYRWDVNFFADAPVFTMNTSRGCPFQCTFCSVGSIWGKRYTCFSAERIVSDIEHLTQTYGAKGIYFREDNFTLDERRLRRFCEFMIDRGLRIPWVCESRVSTLTRELVGLMVRAGLRGFYFGVESGSQRVLNSLQKGITVEQTENAFRWCQEYGVKTAASIVIGVPGESSADLAATAQLLQRISPTITWRNVFVGIPESRLYRHVLQSRVYECIDDRGLVYLPGHNERARRHYGKAWNASIPDSEDRKDWTNKPRVSVLMSVYNGERFVREALQSIYSQTYQDYEVVIVDDGSTDRTPDILTQMKDSRTVIYRNAENMGLTRSLNMGLRLCRGDYVARMDADDVSHPCRLEQQVRFLDGHPDCLVVGTWCYRIDVDGQIVGHWRPRTASEEVRTRLMTANAVAHGSAMIKRAALVEVGGYDEMYECAQDYDLWLRLSERGDIRNLPEQLYGLRSWPQAISTRRKTEQEAFAARARDAARKRRVGRDRVVQGDQDANNRALDYLCQAWTAFEQRRFEAATAHVTRYRQMVDYALFERAVNPVRMQANVEISIVIVTYRRPGDLKRNIKCLSRQQGLRAPFEIIVVDNGRGDHRSFLKDVDQYITCPINLKLAEGRNVGVHFARGRFIVFLDDDALVETDYVASVVAAFEQFDIVGLRGKAYSKNRVKGATNPPVCDRGHRAFPTFCNQEGNSAWRRDIYQRLGGMDPLLFGHEGNDLSFRVYRELGEANRVIYWPRAVIYHDYGDKVKAEQKRAVYEHNTDYLVFKHRVDIFELRTQIEEQALSLPVRSSQRECGMAEAASSGPTNETTCAMSSPCMSVVTACHNAGPFLSECLDSILGQTFTEWELLLLDDGSNDGTRAIIEQYAARDVRIRPFLFDDNKGPYVRRNHAINHARADFIAIHDADDLMYPNKLARLHEAVSQDPRLGVVGSFYRMFLDGRPELDHSEDVILPTTHEEILGRYLTEGICDFSWHGTAVIRKELFDVLGPYDENPFGADSLWLLKVLEYARRIGEIRLGNIPGFLTLRRMHLNSQTGRLPSFDPRSPRVMYWKHVVGKLEKVLKSVDADPRADVAAALRLCTGSDFFEQNGHLFEQWKKAPLTREIAQHLVSTIKCRFEHGKYIQSLIASEMVEQLVAGVASQVPFYDYIRGLAYFCLGFPAKSRECLEAETRAHGTSQAQDFLRRYVEKYNTAWDRRDRAEVGARARPNIPEGTDGGEAPDTASAMRIGRKPTVRQDMCRSRLGAAPGPVAAEPNDDRKRILAELDRKYRAMPDQAAAKHAVAVRLSELCRRVGLVDKSTELAMEAETLRRRGGVATSILPAQIGLRATAGG